MLRISLVIYACLLVSCVKDNGIYDCIYNEVTFVVSDEKGNNLFDPDNPEKMDINDIKLYYVDNTGKKNQQDFNDISSQNVYARYSEKINSYVLVVGVNLNADYGDYAESTINFGPYGEAKIKARVDLLLPLALPMGGTIGYDELMLDGKKIASDQVNKPIHLRLASRSRSR